MLGLWTGIDWDYMVILPFAFAGSLLFSLVEPKLFDKAQAVWAFGAGLAAEQIDPATFVEAPSRRFN